MKTEIDYVVEQTGNNGMKVIKKYVDNRLLMLEENPTIDKGNFVAIEHETLFCRYNEINGKKMNWITD